LDARELAAEAGTADAGLSDKQALADVEKQLATFRRWFLQVRRAT